MEANVVDCTDIDLEEIYYRIIKKLNKEDKENEGQAE